MLLCFCIQTIIALGQPLSTTHLDYHVHPSSYPGSQAHGKQSLQLSCRQFILGSGSGRVKEGGIKSNRKGSMQKQLSWSSMQATGARSSWKPLKRCLECNKIFPIQGIEEATFTLQLKSSIGYQLPYTSSLGMLECQGWIPQLPSFVYIKDIGQKVRAMVELG